LLAGGLVAKVGRSSAAPLRDVEVPTDHSGVQRIVEIEERIYRRLRPRHSNADGGFGEDAAIAD